jgi:hypothetical protein
MSRIFPLPETMRKSGKAGGIRRDSPRAPCAVPNFPQAYRFAVCRTHPSNETCLSSDFTCGIMEAVIILRESDSPWCDDNDDDENI